MKPSLKISLQQRDIDRASKLLYSEDSHIRLDDEEWATSCPISCAFRRITKTHKRVSTDEYSIYVGDTEYDLPRKARQFVERFDNQCNPIKPFTFTIKKAS